MLSYSNIKALINFTKCIKNISNIFIQLLRQRPQKDDIITTQLIKRITLNKIKHLRTKFLIKVTNIIIKFPKINNKLKIYCSFLKTIYFY